MPFEYSLINHDYYNYQLTSDYIHDMPVNVTSFDALMMPFFEISPQKVLTIRNGYAWDGPSGPAVDTKTFMRGSLVHDCLYQLCRMRILNYKTHRKIADDEMRRINIEDGMSRFRAWYTWAAVRAFGGPSAIPRDGKL